MQDPEDAAVEFLVGAIISGLVDLEHACQALLSSAAHRPDRSAALNLNSTGLVHSA